MRELAVLRLADLLVDLEEGFAPDFVADFAGADFFVEDFFEAAGFCSAGIAVCMPASNGEASRELSRTAIGNLVQPFNIASLCGSPH